MENTVLHNLPYFWAAVGVLFLVVEVITGTFYGLAVAIAAFITATFVLLAKVTDWSLPQFFVFFIASVILCVTLPHWFSHKHTTPVGLAAAVGRITKLKRSGEDWKIEIDGVLFLIHTTSVRPDFSEGKSVKISGVKDGLPTVE